LGWPIGFFKVVKGEGEICGNIVMPTFYWQQVIPRHKFADERREARADAS
jgi:hypothetical protein